MKLLKNYISENAEVPIVVLFGGDQQRRQEVIKLILEVTDFTIYGTLSEEEGIKKLELLHKVDLVLIGGRYSDEQRLRIKEKALQLFPSIVFTQPGSDYTYNNNNIKVDIKEKFNL